MVVNSGAPESTAFGATATRIIAALLRNRHGDAIDMLVDFGGGVFAGF